MGGAVMHHPFHTLTIKKEFLMTDTEFKYRPQSLKDYVFPCKEVEEVAKAYASGNVTRPLILSGANGAGKSLLASLIPYEIESEVPQINWIRSCDLNSNKEIDGHFARNKQFDYLFTANNQRYNYYIIEEVNFEAKASDAFRVILDDYRGIDLVIMTTNEIGKVDKGVRSRCEIVNVPACKPDIFFPFALSIIEAEGYEIDEGELMSALMAVYKIRPDNRLYYQKMDELLRKVAA